MPNEYTREQLRQLYIKLPQEIKDVASADETINDIEEICKRNEVTDERVGTISDLIRNVLFGVLPPDDFQKELEKEVKLEKEVAKKVAQEINRFIFYPVKPALEELHKIEISPPAQPTKIAPPPEEKLPTESAGEDRYRESIE